MSFEDVQAELAILINDMDEQPHNLQEIHEKIREKLNELKAFGMPLPDNLVKLEEQLEQDITNQTGERPAS